MSEEEKDLDAAERALGTEPREGESLADARRRRIWEAWLAPLAGRLAPVPPPDGLFDRITARIEQEDERDAARTALRRARRSVHVWRSVAVGMSVAAALFLTFALRPPVPDPASARYVALATPEGGGPAFLVEIDTAEGRATIVPVSIEAPDSGALEMWHIPAGQSPRSLGVIDPSRLGRTDLAANPGDLLAVSLEPTGGSPTGAPTGPVLFSGPLIEVDSTAE